MVPGEYILKKEEILANEGQKTVSISVKNEGDRPIQIGSHYHFFETNRFLSFNREKAFGMRLNIPASTAIRFEPGEEKKVILVEIGGNKEVHGFNNLTNGKVSDVKIKTAALAKVKEQKYRNSK